MMQTSSYRAEIGAGSPAAEDTLRRAIELHRADRLREAEPLYAAVLAAEPDHPDALHFFGVLKHRRGGSEEGAALIRRSLAFAPDNPDALNNLGNVLLESDRVEEAAAAYRQVVALRPDSAAAHHNLGVALQLLEQPNAAEAALEQAIALEPRNALFHYSLGRLWLRQGAPAAALPILKVALWLAPDFALAHQASLRAILWAGDDPAAAVEALDQWLEREPDNPVARHLHAAHSGRAIPARASDGYVRSVFDQYAATFDAHLDTLGYRAPQLLQAALARVLGEPRGALDVLDAGCGTGLCGPLLRPFARRLAGIDLVEAMLARARARDIYDELTAGELTAFIAARHHAYDLIVAADTLVYFGDLSAVVGAAAGALRPGGVLAFSLERLDAEPGESGYRLEQHGRYSHDVDYVRRVADEAGLAIVAFERAVPRRERGEPVAGLVVVARKPAD